MGGSAITEKDPKATTDRIPRRTRQAMVRAHRCILAPPENPVPAKIFDLPIHGLRQPPPERGWLAEFRKQEQAFSEKGLKELGPSAPPERHRGRDCRMRAELLRRAAQGSRRRNRAVDRVGPGSPGPRHGNGSGSQS